jgi:hypothetical protein
MGTLYNVDTNGLLVINSNIAITADNKGDLTVQKVNSNATKIILPVKIA